MTLCRRRQVRYRNWSDMLNEEFHYINLVEKLRNLKENGFFYVREWTCADESGGKNSIWQYSKAWLEKVISQEWLQKPIEEISMEFVHFFTGDKMYLHITREEYGYKDGGQVRMFFTERQFIREKRFFVVNSGKPCFGQVLCDCDIYADCKVFRQIPECALKSFDETFFSAFYEKSYIQTKVARVAEEETACGKLYWAGEFVKKAVSGETGQETEYLYLVQLRTDAKSNTGKGGYTCVKDYMGPKLYMLKTKERMTEICPEDGQEILLQDMPWLKRPFSNYYDLPEEESEVVSGEPCVAHGYGGVEFLLEQLKCEGYVYRREQVWDAGDEEIETRQILSKSLGIQSEYLECGLTKVQMEFVNPETGRRKYLVIAPDEQILYESNGVVWQRDEKLHTEYFREDRSLYARYYDEEKVSSYKEEIILPEPICLDLLKKYELITSEQIRLCHLSGESEFKDWFEMTDPVPWIGGEEEVDIELRQAEEEKAARARRVARGLKYRLVEECEMDGRKVEIYANEQRSRAIYLVDNGVICKVKFVDMYMNVNAALS